MTAVTNSASSHKAWRLSLFIIRLSHHAPRHAFQNVVALTHLLMCIAISNVGPNHVRCEPSGGASAPSPRIQSPSWASCRAFQAGEVALSSILSTFRKHSPEIRFQAITVFATFLQLVYAGRRLRKATITGPPFNDVLGKHSYYRIWMRRDGHPLHTKPTDPKNCHVVQADIGHFDVPVPRQDPPDHAQVNRAQQRIFNRANS